MMFSDFWAVYPRKVAKKNAEKAWKKLNPSETLGAYIVADVIKRSKSDQWRKEAGQFIPHPATYLNGERWHDEEPGQELPTARRVGASTSFLDYETTIQVEPAKA